MNDKEIIKRYGSDLVEMTYTLLNHAGLSEEIGDRDLRVGIKPNLVTPTPASFGATTHPEIVEGIIKYLQDNSFKNITVLEGSWVGDKTSEAYINCGYKSLVEKYDVKFIDTQKDHFHEKDCAGMELSICDSVDDIDYMINVPVLKGHCQTKMTCALKNMKGLIPNSEKRKFHTMGLHKPIAHLSQGIHQDFVVVDHICGDPNFEEGGNPLQTDCVMVCKDPVLIDSYACSVLGLSAEDVPYVGMAEKLGSGSTDLSKAVIRILNENGEVIKEFSADKNDPYEKIFTHRDISLDVSVDVDECDSCSACFASFTSALYRMKDEGEWRSGCLPRISIGQGHKGKTGAYGIGNCCKEFDHFIKGCPTREEDIYHQFRKWMEKST